MKWPPRRQDRDKVAHSGVAAALDRCPGGIDLGAPDLLADMPLTEHQIAKAALAGVKTPVQTPIWTATRART